MIKLFIFDMGGVMIRDFNVSPKLTKYLNLEYDTITGNKPELKAILLKHSEGLITEDEFWNEYNNITNLNIVYKKESLLGKFFTPYLDEDTVNLVKDLKNNGYKVVCGTNVIQSHFDIHNKLNQYDVFDAVYPSHYLHIAKPKVEFYKKICEAENVDTKDAFFIDDLKENVEAAKKVGLSGYVYDSSQGLKKELHKYGIL